MNPPAPPAPPAPPVLRGWLHLVCFFLAVPVGVWLVATAPTGSARAGAAVYAVGLAALFGVSGSYHRGRWSATWKRRMQRLDHSTIYVMIAGSYTPLCVVLLRPSSAAVLLGLVWAGAALGAVFSWRDGRFSVIASNVLYIALGWLVVVAGRELLASLAASHLWLLGAGGLLFTVGAITLATRWPDPAPRVFGYHEVWHVLVVAAVVLQLIVIGSVLRAADTL